MRRRIRPSGASFGAGGHRDYSLAELQLWAVSQGPTSFLIDLEPYEQCRVAGVVQKLRLDPGGGGIEVVVSDGTGTTTARWRMRRPTRELALAPGRGVVLEGVTTIAADGHVMFEEPAFRTAPLGHLGLC